MSDTNLNNLHSMYALQKTCRNPYSASRGPPGMVPDMNVVDPPFEVCHAAEP